MPRPRLPDNKAEVSGAKTIHPGRFAGRKKPARTRPLGDPYKCMNDAQREAWEEFRDELPWLNSSHRALLQIACVFRARLMAGGDMGVVALQSYSAILSKLGATPVDETRVTQRDDADEDPADRFFQRPH
jgi:hypothetical protein